MLFETICSTLNSLLLFALHIESKNVFPKPLSKSEEEECFRKVSEGDDKARARLIEHNLRLVAHIIKKYYSDITEQEELISIGTVGLIKAVSTFDYTKGNRFATYASRCIENEILMHFRSRKKSQGDIYIDEPIDTDKDGNQLTLLDIMSDETDVIEQIDLSIQSAQLYDFLEKALNKREFEIIKYRYGLYGCRAMTQREVAQKLNISRSYVSNIAYYKWMAIAKKLRIDHSFFILCIGQALIRIVHYNFNADIPQSGLLKVLKAVYEIILLALNCRKTADSYVYRYV
ncbi:MAG: RNA polymerase sporulation sigma factor SigK [Porcipelethomonas sp.]